MTSTGTALGILAISLLVLAASCDIIMGEFPNIPFRLLASQKTLSNDFWEVAPEDVLIRIATDPKTLGELWSYFGLEAEVPALTWDKEIVMLLGTGEPSNCPLEVKEVAFDDGMGRLTVHLEQHKPPEGICLMDFTPRTFSLALPRSLIDSGWREVQVTGIPREPVLPVPFR